MNKKKSIFLMVSLVIVAFIITSFSKEETNDNTTYWYSSENTKGYKGNISIQTVQSLLKDSIEITTVHTDVNARFSRKKNIVFKLSTNSYGTRMLDPYKLTFNGLIGKNIEPVSFVGTALKGEKDGESFWSFKGDYLKDAIKDEKAKEYISSDHTAMIRIPKRTIPSFNIWAIVPNLAFDKKGTFKFNMLDETKLRVTKNLTINYLGKYNTVIDGKEMMLHKFVQQGKKLKPTYYWVSDAKVLMQVLLDDKFTFTLTTKEKALQKK